MLAPLDVCIDVSDAQGAYIDWKAVAASGVRVAFIKAMEGSASGYSTWPAQSGGARSVDIEVIPYIFLRPSDPVVVATNFQRVTGLAKGIAFALDWEGRASQTAAPTAAEAIGAKLAAIAERVPVGYWGIPGSTPAQPTPAMAKWDRWIPRYPQSPQPPNFAAMHPSSVAKKPAGALFWQYTSNGRVAGISGPVDRSVWCGTEAELTAWLTTGAYPAASTPP